MEKENKWLCETCKYKVATSPLRGKCEDCLKGNCIYCCSSRGSCLDYEKDNEVSSYLKQLHLDDEYVMALYNINDSLLEMNLEDIKELIRILKLK